MKKIIVLLVALSPLLLFAQSEYSGPIFKVVENAPVISGCEDVGNKKQKKECTDEKVLKLLYSNIKHTPVEQEDSEDSIVIISFIVEKDGNISGSKIFRKDRSEIEDGFKDEILQAVNMLPKWNPALQRGRSVRAQYMISIIF